MAVEQMGSLVVVGTGIQIVGQMTIEARYHIRNAEKLLFVVADSYTPHWLAKLNPTAESLRHFYQTGKQRAETYQDMVEYILSWVRRGQRVCAAFYGHPGVFAIPPHDAIRRARAEGFEARMLPGVSAEDSLFADLGIDPGRCGCQGFEATDFLVYQRQYDPHVPLILWQIGVLGILDYSPTMSASRERLEILVERVLPIYGPDHECVLYVAALYPKAEPQVQVVRLEDLPTLQISPMATLYLKPKVGAPFDGAMAARLGIAVPSPSPSSSAG
jgi:uncharacterized protein YabN with tetrapyrrole methylase and pyrophosphatase domain